MVFLNVHFKNVPSFSIARTFHSTHNKNKLSKLCYFENTLFPHSTPSPPIPFYKHQHLSIFKSLPICAQFCELIKQSKAGSLPAAK